MNNQTKFKIKNRLRIANKWFVDSAITAVVGVVSLAFTGLVLKGMWVVFLYGWRLIPSLR